MVDHLVHEDFLQSIIRPVHVFGDPNMSNHSAIPPAGPGVSAKLVSFLSDQVKAALGQNPAEIAGIVSVVSFLDGLGSYWLYRHIIVRWVLKAYTGRAGFSLSKK